MAKDVVAESARQRRRPTRSGVILSEELIVATALRMLAHHGNEGLTVRRLGAALGSDPSAIYRYFRSMDELALAITDELIARATRQWEPTGDWREDLESWGLSAHAEYLAHPEAAMMASHRISGREAEMAAVDRLVGVLREAGFPDADATQAYNVFINQMLAFASLDGARRSLPESARAADRDLWKTTYTGASAANHPHIAATAAHLARLGERSAYPLALQLLLDGLSAVLTRLTAARCASGQAMSTTSTTEITDKSIRNQSEN